eukprot:CAMPEP_0119299694 /NCGR_PEP_ID=MMETSP1333-20130426/1735_1 /TAXON_ID=418940 /ORGANISM="Scyphosphaera apsteinii, Strain RCC1455" /LENGTH=108 /DNA_ID=CAMNT_0007301203 /DNA_START=323 /DNA_END=645 /DNA_ORIENTATION=+
MSVFELLQTTDELRLITDWLPDGDALSVALCCKATRDAVFARFTSVHDRVKRLASSHQDSVCSVVRLSWAVANGLRWNKYICEAAASEGHLAVLQWARANGCDWGAGT